MITLMPRDWLDVETGSSGTSVIGGDLIWVSGQLDLYGSHHAIVPNSALVNGRADQAGCIALMQKRSDGYVTRERLAQGVVVCIATTEGSVAELRITPPDIHDALQVELTTWR
jgi:hypothetical protein